MTASVQGWLIDARVANFWVATTFCSTSLRQLFFLIFLCHANAHVRAAVLSYIVGYTTEQGFARP